MTITLYAACSSAGRFFHGLCNGSAAIWDDDYVDPAKADLWEFFTKHVLQEARKKAADSGDGGGGGGLGMLSGMVGGAGGGKNFNTAEIHLQNGQAHYENKEFAQAMECYKAASNWYRMDACARVVDP